MEKWTRVKYQPNLPLRGNRRVTASEEHILLSKEAAKEGMVLLKNDKDLLPLKPGSRIALFGKGTFDYVKGGGGSGDVTVSYVHNLYDGLHLLGDAVQIYEPLCDFYRSSVKEQYAAGAEPGMTREPVLPDQLADQARVFADTALIVLCRFSGEAWDRSSIDCDNGYSPWTEENSMPKKAGEIFPEGDFYLTKEEKAMVAQVTSRFEKVAVVLNIGGVMDLRWAQKNESISSILLGWQGGMEGGLAMAELLTGYGNPSGKLTDTFAGNLEAYPSTEGFHESFDYVDYIEDIYVGYRYFETIPGAAQKVVYPFGYGLSYTTFSISLLGMQEEKETIQATVQVVNTGRVEGKEVVQIYAKAPGKILDQPARSLVAFEKTRLLKPGELQILTLFFEKKMLAAYDDLGKIRKSAYILEQGTYEFSVGNSVRDAKKAPFAWEVPEHIVVTQLQSHLAPTRLAKRMLSDGTFEELPLGTCNDKDACIFEKMKPGSEEMQLEEFCGQDISPFYDRKKHHLLIEVAEGTLSLEDFISQLSDEEQIHLLGGQPNTGVGNTLGVGNLPKYGIPTLMTADGPAGLRIWPECSVYTTAFPCATLLACTWNPSLVMEVGKAGAEEVKENNLAIWLTPAVNIHRNPLCGRNFEYYSEDPLIAGKMGAAMVKGIQSQHIAASVKHFAANNKEVNRHNCDSRVSERALREIYLKCFEIIVREAQPWTMMTSYNPVNGYRTGECKELLEDILRGEWGFQGMVTTDWGTCGEHYKEIQAGNDLKMSHGYPQRVKKALNCGELKREDLERSVRRVLELILKID